MGTSGARIVLHLARILQRENARYGVTSECIGGGLELALACDFRIARADSKLGFPEVQLGLHPGLGGTARLTRTMAPHQSLQMMLTGKPVSAHRAKALGLVDAVGEERDFTNAVRDAAAGKLTPLQRLSACRWVPSSWPTRSAWICV